MKQLNKETMNAKEKKEIKNPGREPKRTKKQAGKKE
jgi:hypothetical protein